MIKFWFSLNSIVFSGLLLVVFYQRQIVLFRDYSIIWDGATRMLAGQSAFEDFGMPTGPVVLWIPYAFMHLFGVDWEVFQASQLFLNALTIINVIFLLQKLEIRKFVISLSLLFLVIFYLIFISHPWYNTTALLLVLFSFNLLLSSNLFFKTFLSGVITGLCFFTKQDFGLLLFLSSLAILIFDFYHEKRKFKILAMHFSLYCIGVSSVILGFVYLYTPEYFSYWFNYGQAPHTSRIGHLRNLVYPIVSPAFVFGLFLIGSSFFYKLRSFLVFGLVFCMGATTIVTSGLYFSHFYTLWTLPPILYLTFTNSRLFQHRSLCIVLSLLVCVPVIKHTAWISENILGNQHEHWIFNKRHLNPMQNIVNYSECSKVLKNIYGPEDICRLIRDLKSRINSGEIPKGGRILNMTELTPLTIELGFSPPRLHPLWYHGGISLFLREKEIITKQVINSEFDIVLIQGISIGTNQQNKDFHLLLLKHLRANSNFHEFPKSYLSPSSYTDAYYADTKIFVFFKKNRNKQ